LHWHSTWAAIQAGFQQLCIRTTASLRARLTDTTLHIQRMVACRLLLAGVLAVLCLSSVDARVSAAEYAASQVCSRIVPQNWFKACLRQVIGKCCIGRQNESSAECGCKPAIAQHVSNGCNAACHGRACPKGRLNACKALSPSSAMSNVLGIPPWSPHNEIAARVGGMRSHFGKA